MRIEEEKPFRCKAILAAPTNMAIAMNLNMRC